MISVVLEKGKSTCRVNDGLSITLSRPVKTKTIIELKTPDQHKKQEIEKRRKVQNRTIWMICTDVAEHTGELVKDVYFDFKFDHLAPFIAADDEEFAFFHEKFMESRLIIDPLFWRMVANQAYTAQTSTVKQFANAMDEFMRDLNVKRVPYRHPDDFKRMMNDPFYQSLIK